MNNTPEEWLELAKDQIAQIEASLSRGARHHEIVYKRLDSVVELIQEAKDRLEREEYFSRPENSHKVMPSNLSVSVRCDSILAVMGLRCDRPMGHPVDADLSQYPAAASPTGGVELWVDPSSAAMWIVR